MDQTADFEVGEKEKHQVSFKLDSWWGKFSIFVDGKPTEVSNVSYISGPFSVEVGDQEKHTVTIQVHMEALFPAFRKKKIQVLIDNKLFKTF